MLTVYKNNNPTRPTSSPPNNQTSTPPSAPSPRNSETGPLNRNTLYQTLKNCAPSMEHDRKKNFKTESRLKAVNMQLACANNQVAMVTENEAKLCSRIKELQLRIDQLEFDIERGKSSPGGVLNHSSVGNLIEQPFVPLLTSKDRSKSSRKHEKKDRKEKDQINQIFSSDIIRSTRKDKSAAKSRKAASTPVPHTDRSDTTIKFTDNNYPEDISRINEG
ncbi:uncharacterized protein LOC134822288 [Bolinopsis microptera]|uniref:uncharacterized protein LOC134822288 n=1 Tax=Bolinopsis microptera TaxID=2820187 RepID=UPI00307AB240